MPVLLVHGLTDTSRVFRTMQPYLEGFGHEVHCLDLVPNNGEAPLDVLGHQLAEYVRRHMPGDQKFDLVGFSMGGIVSRYYVQRLGGLERVRRFVTISSPHQGTWTARLRGGPGIQQMRRGSEFLAGLNRDCECLEQLGFTSIWTRYDLMIVPARSSVLPVGRSIHVGAPAHFLMVRDARVLEIVRQLLDHTATAS